jgi:hypothetical protein
MRLSSVLAVLWVLVVRNNKAVLVGYVFMCASDTRYSVDRKIVESSRI